MPKDVLGISNSFKELKIKKEDDYLKIWLKSPAEKGKANKELIKALKSIFGEFSFVSVVRRKYIKIDYDNKRSNRKNDKV